jgi:TRAP-type uncharacterized transport system fused permease subunit
MRTTKEKMIKQMPLGQAAERQPRLEKVDKQSQDIDRTPAKHIKTLSVVGYIIFLLAVVSIIILFTGNLSPEGAAFFFYVITIACLFSFIFILLALSKYNRYNKQIKHLNIREFLGMHMMNSINIVLMVILSLAIIFGVVAIISILLGALAGTV